MCEKYQKLDALIGQLNRHTCISLNNDQLDVLLNFTSGENTSSSGHTCLSHTCTSPFYEGHTKTILTYGKVLSLSGPTLSHTVTPFPFTCTPVTKPRSDDGISTKTCSICLLLLHLSCLKLVLKHHLLTSTHLQQRPGIIKFLVDCVYCRDIYVSYTGSRVLISLLKEHIIQCGEVKTCFQNLLHYLSNVYTSEDRIEYGTSRSKGDNHNEGIFSNIMTVFKEILCVNSEEAQIALDVIHIKWDSLQPLFRSISPSVNHCVSVNSFLSLLKTLVKLHADNRWIVPAVFLLVPDLFSSLRKDSIPGYLKINTLQLLHQLVSLEIKLDNKETRVCEEIINWILVGGLGSVSSTEEDIGGFGWRLSLEEQKTSDNLQLKQMTCLLSLKVVSNRISRKRNSEKHNVPDETLTVLETISNSFGRDLDSKWLTSLYMNQDDVWISALLSLLNIHIHLIHCDTDDRVASLRQSYNIHHCVRDFLSVILYDHTVIIDLLSSPETQCLLFILLYLKFIRHDWEDFCQSHSDSDRQETRPLGPVESVTVNNSAEKQFDRQKPLSENSLPRAHLTQGGAILPDDKNFKSTCSEEPVNLKPFPVQSIKESLYGFQSIPSKISNDTPKPFLIHDTDVEHSSVDQSLTTSNSNNDHPVGYMNQLPASIPPGSLQSLCIYDSSDSEGDMDDTCTVTGEPSRKELPRSGDCELSDLYNTYVGATGELKHSYKPSIGQQSTEEQDSSGDSDSDGQVEMSHFTHIRERRENQLSQEIKTSGDSVTCKSPVEEIMADELLVGDSSAVDMTMSEEVMPNDLGTQDLTVDITMSEEVMPTDSGTQDLTVDKIMSVFIRLRLGLEHLVESGLFPYDIKPLLTVLEDCETLYETP